MERSNSKIKCWVDEVATDHYARTFIHLRFGNNSAWCELKEAFKVNSVGKTTRLYKKALTRDRFLVGELNSCFGTYPYRTIVVNSGFGISYIFDEIKHSKINFIK